jgi:hypothetical protein
VVDDQRHRCSPFLRSPARGGQRPCWFVSRGESPSPYIS